MDPITRRIYTSRHVKFIETEFPYAKPTTSTSLPKPNDPLHHHQDMWGSISLPMETNPTISSQNDTIPQSSPSQSPTTSSSNGNNDHMGPPTIMGRPQSPQINQHNQSHLDSHPLSNLPITEPNQSHIIPPLSNRPNQIQSSNPPSNQLIPRSQINHMEDPPQISPHAPTLAKTTNLHQNPNLEPNQFQIPNQSSSSLTTTHTILPPQSTSHTSLASPQPLPDAPSRAAPTTGTQLPNPNPRSPNPLPTTTTSLDQRGIVTRSKNNIHKPIQKLNLTSQVSKPKEPKTITQALKDPDWRNAMQKEFDALCSNQTWSLVPHASNHSLVGCKWVYRIKYKPDGTIDRYKARLVAKGFHQRPGLDYTETFSPVIKPVTVRFVLTLAIQSGWPLHQLDVNNAFLHGTLHEDVYMVQPPGFINKDKPHHVCKLKKALYGLKQAPRAWYNELRLYLLHLGFTNSIADVSLFILRRQHQLTLLLVYVDDIIITGNHQPTISKLVSYLGSRFSLKDLVPLSYFLGVEVMPNPNGIFLSQKKYIEDLLIKAGMDATKPVSTPMSATTTLVRHSGDPLPVPTDYRTLVGSLQYLCLTRLDIAYTVNKLSQFMHSPTTEHWNALKRLLRYLSGTIHFGIHISSSSPPILHAFSDADWAGDKDDFISTTGYIIYFGSSPISWSSRKQKSVARSSTEAEYKALADTTSELLWILSLMKELGVHSHQQPVIHCDNLGATSLSANPVFHSRMKHIALAFHFVRECVQNGTLRVSHVSTKDQLADILTKPLLRARFNDLINKLGLITWRRA